MPEMFASKGRTRLDAAPINHDELPMIGSSTSAKPAISGGARSDKGDPNTHISFVDKIDGSKVTSIRYGGEVFTAQ